MRGLYGVIAAVTAVLVVASSFLSLAIFSNVSHILSDPSFSAAVFAVVGGVALLLGFLLARIATAAALGLAIGGGIVLTFSGLGALFIWRNSAEQVFWAALAAIAVSVLISWFINHFLSK